MFKHVNTNIAGLSTSINRGNYKYKKHEQHITHSLHITQDNAYWKYTFIQSMAWWPYVTPSHYPNRWLILTNTVISLPEANRVIFGKNQEIDYTTLQILRINTHLSGDITLILQMQKCNTIWTLNTMHVIYLQLDEIFCGILICCNSSVVGLSVACDSLR